MLGELFFYGTAGAALIAWAAWGYWRSGARDRANLLAIGFAVALVVLFAVAIDGAQAKFIDAPGPYNGFVSLVEDGGEMVGLSLLLALMIRLYQQGLETLVTGG